MPRSNSGGSNQIISMKTILRFYSILICLPLFASDGGNTLPRVSAVMKKAVETHQVSGVVTVVATKDRILHCEALGLADIAKSASVSHARATRVA